MKKVSLLLALMSTILSYAQSEVQVEVDLGYTFQEEMTLNDEILDNKGAFGVRFGANYLKRITNKFYAETGFYGKFNTGKKKIENLTFSSYSLKVQLPLYAGYKINDTWRISLGVSLENNKDFNKIDFTTEDNIRFDLLTKLVYRYNTKIQFLFYTNWMLNSTYDAYTISSPKNGVYFGVIYQLWDSKKTKDQ